MSYRTLEEVNFTGGVNKEIPPWLLPAGTLADASNMIFDEPGIARQRNGSTALSSPTTTAFAEPLGFAYSQDGVNTIEELYGADGKGGIVYSINKTTGVAASVGGRAAAGTPGRPVRHFGFVIFPFPLSASAEYNSYVAAGETVNTNFSNTAAWTVTANVAQITLTGADVTTNVKVGAIVLVTAGAAGENYYLGRVVSVDTTKLFTVWPTPPTAITSGGGGSLATSALVTGLDSTTRWGGQCVTSFQNRLLYGGVNVPSATITTRFDRRVAYSVLPTETIANGSGPGGNTGIAGATFLWQRYWPALNYFDVPGSDPIVAMEPISDNELLILTTQGVIIFRGTLATQTTTSAPGITFDISPLNTNAGCLSDLSVAKTPHGIIWASPEGVMLYTGGGRSPIDLTEGKYHTAWRNLTRGSSFAIHGAFFARNHYVVSGSSGGSTFSLAFNLDNQTWAPLSGTGTDIFNGAARPTDPSQVYVHRWWDVTGAAPTQTGGSVVRVDSLFAPDVAGQTKTDSDGGVVAFSMKSRTLTGDQELERIVRRVAVRGDLEAFPASGTAAVTVAVGARLDSADTAGTPTVSVGNFSNTSTLTITGQSNATPIVITTSGNHGLQSEDQVDIRGVTTNSNANGRWRITVISNTTFSLNGSTGNGATTSTGTCKRVTEQEFVASSVDIGQGHWVNLASNGTVNRFKIHGFRMGVMTMDRGMAMSRG